MISHQKHVAGWLDSSIADFLEEFPHVFESMKYSLITCLDSNTEPASLLETSPALDSFKKEAKRIGPGVLLPTQLLLGNEPPDSIFFGFDEIWFFPHEIEEQKPRGGSLVGPSRANQRTLDSLAHWLSTNSCTMGLGDGCGLNLVVKAQGLVWYILGHSLDQSGTATALMVASDFDVSG